MADAVIFAPQSRTVHSFSNSPANAPASNLLNDKLGRVWQAANGDYCVLSSTGLNTPVAISDAFAVLATDAAATDQFRVRTASALSRITGAVPTGPFTSDMLIAAHASADAARRIHRNAFYQLPTAVNTNYLRIDVISSGTINIGRMFSGSLLPVSDNVDYGWTFEVVDNGETETGRLGIDDSLIGSKVLQFKWTWSWMTEAEARGAMLDIMAYAGTTRPILMCMDPEATDLHNVIAYGKFQQLAAFENYIHDTYQAEFVLKSKLILNL